MIGHPVRPAPGPAVRASPAGLSDSLLSGTKRVVRGVRSRRGIVMSNVVVVIGPGSIGQAIARRVSAGKQVLLAGLRQGNVNAAGGILSDAGFDVSTATVDVSS